MDKSDNKKETPINNKPWLLNIINPLLVAIIGGLLLYYIEKLSEPKTGELAIQCNVDSANVFLNGEFKGLTQKIDTLNNIYMLKIHSIYPGSYNLKLQRSSMKDVFIQNVEINPGYLTSKLALLFPKIKKSGEKASLKIDLKNKADTLKTRAEKNKIPVKEETRITELNKLNDKILTLQLTINLTEQIKLGKVSLFVDSSFMGSPTSHDFSIELLEGIHKIILTYSDEMGFKYIYSNTINISQDDILTVLKNDFQPM
jgi:hypothetical protein